MTNLDSAFKSKDITLPTRVCLFKAMVFLVVLHGCESWTIKKAELDESQAEIKIAKRNINNLRYADDTTLMTEVKRN